MVYSFSYLLASSFILNSPISIHLYVATWPWHYRSADILLLFLWQDRVYPNSAILLSGSLLGFSTWL